MDKVIKKPANSNIKISNGANVNVKLKESNSNIKSGEVIKKTLLLQGLC